MSEHFSDSRLIRIAIGQLLADNGVNKRTIENMVRDAINERVDKTLKTFIAQNLDAQVQRIVQIELQKALREAVRRETNAISIHIKYDNGEE